MSILQVANVQFDSTGANRIEYTGNNVIRVKGAGLQLPVVTNATKPSPEAGMMLYNSDTGNMEMMGSGGAGLSFASNTSVASANNYAGSMANSVNTYTSATYSTLTQFGSVFGVANAAFAAANAEFTFSNTIYAAVNSAFAVINAAYTSSNADYVVSNAAFAAANSKVASVTGTAGQIFSSGGTAPTLNLISSGVTATTYGGSTNVPVLTVDAFGRITSAANQSFSAGGVTSVSGAGTVSGLTLTGTVTTTGSLTLGGTLSATIDNISDEHRLFNNMGDNHATRASFDATNPSYNFGWRFVQGLTNGPGVNGAGQYYSEYVGLGNDYLATGAGSYGMQIAYPRNVSTPYIAIRYNENNTLGAWQKISAGYADTVGSITSGQVTTALGYTPYNSTNPSGYITSSALSPYAPLAGATFTGLIIGMVPTTSGVGGGNDTGSMSIRGDGSKSAHISFHRAGAYAINMGLDTDNVFRIGGWSDGATTYRLQLATPGGTSTLNGILVATADMRAPIFYDQNNTGYYVNPDGTSNIVKLITSSRIVLPSTNDGRTNGLWHWGDSDSNWVQYMAQPTVGTNPAGTTMVGGYWDNGHNIRVRAGGWSYETNGNVLRAHINGTGAFFAGQTRSPIYYDSDNTAYYVDPASTSVFAGDLQTNGRVTVGVGQTSSWVEMRDTDESTRYIHNNSSTIGFVGSAGNWRLRVADNGDVLMGTYQDWLSTQIRSAIFYDNQDTGYYSDPNGTTRLNVLNVIGNFSVASQSKFNHAAGSGTFPVIIGADDMLNMPQDRGIMVNMRSGAGIALFATVNNGTTQSGYVVASGSTIGFVQGSDYRLKEKVQNMDLDDAAQKINNLRPVNFEWIHDGDDRKWHGFIAHEVQKQIPQAIYGEKDAMKEDGTPDYQGIDMVIMIPIVVGAIKKLQQEVKLLQQEVELLKNK
jgi:hypothetical protein